MEFKPIIETKLGVCQDCDEGLAQLQLYINQNQYGEGIVWRVKNETKNIIFENPSEIHVQRSPYLYYDLCLPVNHCFTLIVEDLGKSDFSYVINCPWQVEPYAVFWNK